MLASELITKLQAVVAEHGDLPVWAGVINEWESIAAVEYDPSDDTINVKDAYSR